MDRKHQLVSCKKCENRSFDFKKGIICGLTNEQANFERTCPDFKEDVNIQKAKTYSENIGKNHNNRYPALKYVIAINIAIGWIIGISTIIIVAIMIYGISDLPYFEIASLTPILYILFTGLSLAIFLIANAEFLKVIVDIEKNTRNS
tara:strand:- start:157 stop:597 length:441 start_codon:yes stop_codon:yes gene_type:complete